MTGAIRTVLLVVMLGVLAVLVVALWRSARSGTGVGWPLAVGALVLGGIGTLAILSPD